MQPQKPQDALNDIVNHIKTAGASYPYKKWYAGITNNWKDRLFNQHKVSKEMGYIARQCTSMENAKLVEDALIKAGCQGGTTGGTIDSVYVYAYVIHPTTVQ